MFRRITLSTHGLAAVGLRFGSEMSKPVTTAPIVSSDPFQERKGADPNELLKEFLKKAEDPMGLPKTKATNWVNPKNPDNYLYNRGNLFVPTPAEHNSRCSSERYQLGQIKIKDTLMGTTRHETQTVKSANIAHGNLLARFNNFAEEGTVHVRCEAINPLEHDMTYHGTKKFKYGKITRAITGGTYLRL